MSPIITVEACHYAYPGTVALNDVSFTLEAGTVTALIGPNGAGKTTLMNCLAALTRPQKGSITIDGVDVLQSPRRSHQLIGYLPDFFGVYEQLSVERCLRYMGMAQNIPANKLNDAIILAAERAELTDLLPKKAGALSRGQRQRLAIAQAIVHEPKVLLLDEPAAGLDPQARHHLSGLFVALARAGVTLLVSSHILSELEDYCTHLLMIRDGEILQQSDIANANNNAAQQRILVLTTTMQDLKTKKILEEDADISDIVTHEKTIEFVFTGDEVAQQQLLKQLVLADCPVTSLAPKAIKLQDAYIKKMSE